MYSIILFMTDERRFEGERASGDDEEVIKSSFDRLVELTSKDLVKPSVETLNHRVEERQKAKDDLRKRLLVTAAISTTLITYSQYRFGLPF